MRRERAAFLHARILALHAEGLANTDIAERVGSSPGSVSNIVRAAGLRGHDYRLTEAERRRLHAAAPAAAKWTSESMMRLTGGRPRA